MKAERRPKNTFVKNNKAQMGTVMAILVGSITILIGVIVFVQVFHALPETGPSVANESWVWDNVTANKWTKQLNHTNMIERTPETVKVYNGSGPFAETVDYTINHKLGQITNVSTGGIVTNGTYGIDYEYEEAGVVNAKTSVAGIFYSAMGLVIIGFLVLAAVFILAVVGRLRGKGE